MEKGNSHQMEYEILCSPGYLLSLSAYYDFGYSQMEIRDTLHDVLCTFIMSHCYFFVTETALCSLCQKSI
jgi:hypothetical protein